MLPNFFKPFLISEKRLKRLGSKNDGGYVVDIDAVSKTKAFISFGICDNWDFENDFIKNSNVTNVHLFDNQTSLTFLLKRIIFSFLKFKFKSSVVYLHKLIDFLKIKKNFKKSIYWKWKRRIKFSEYYNVL